MSSPVDATAADKRRPTDTNALRLLQDAGDELLHDYKTVEGALLSSEAHEYCASIASTVRRLNGRLSELLDRLEDSRGGQIERDGDARRLTS